MHIRHNDFYKWCDLDIPPTDCFAPLSAYARRVAEVRAALAARYPATAPPARVLVTSDDASPAFVAEVAALEWARVDHDAPEWDTEARFGGWYPPLLDAVFQSGGRGFVGTDRSTMSLVAGRRVEDWHGGIYAMVRWGHKDADAH